MASLKVKDIEIIYDDEKNINDIKNVITNNYQLFQMILGSKKKISLVEDSDEDTLYICNFDDFFSEAINQIFNPTAFGNPKDHKDLLIQFYLEYLIRNNSNFKKGLFEPNNGLSDELLIDFLAYFYYTKTSNFNDFVDYLKNRQDFVKIIEWTKKEIRFELYNYILKCTGENLKKYYFDMLDSVSDIVGFSLNKMLDSRMQREAENNVELPKITMHELDSLFIEFLNYINAPEDWHKIYNNLKINNQIVFKKDTNNCSKSKCYKNENGVWNIYIDGNETIETFCAFVHEFMHYISIHKLSKTSNFSLEEFPSIFFENIAKQFLKDKGYQQSIIDKILEFRNKDNEEIFASLFSLFMDLKTSINGFSISREQRISCWRNYFNQVEENKKELIKFIRNMGEEIEDDYFGHIDIDIESAVDNDCDTYTNAFIEEGVYIIDGYQYLFDTYLAEELLNQVNKDGSVIAKMINITEDLENVSLKDVIHEFSIKGLTDSQIGEKTMN